MQDYLNYYDLGNEIKQRIKKLQMSQKSLADELYISREWLNKMLNNIDLMDQYTLRNICLKLGIKGITFQ